MDADTLKQLGGVAVLLGIGGFNAWQAHKAARQTKATGNGYAARTEAALKRIEEKADATHALMVEHLADHAGSDLSR